MSELTPETPPAWATLPSLWCWAACVAAERPITIDEVAAATRWLAPTCMTLMRDLVRAGVLVSVEGGRFAPGPLNPLAVLPQGPDGTLGWSEEARRTAMERYAGLEPHTPEVAQVYRDLIADYRNDGERPGRIAVSIDADLARQVREWAEAGGDDPHEVMDALIRGWLATLTTPERHDTP